MTKYIILIITLMCVQLYNVQSMSQTIEDISHPIPNIHNNETLVDIYIPEESIVNNVHTDQNEFFVFNKNEEGFNIYSLVVKNIAQNNVRTFVIEILDYQILEIENIKLIANEAKQYMVAPSINKPEQALKSDSVILNLKNGIKTIENGHKLSQNKKTIQRPSNKAEEQDQGTSTTSEQRSDNNFLSAILLDTLFSGNKPNTLQKGKPLIYLSNRIYLQKGTELTNSCINSDRYYIVKDAIFTLVYNSSLVKESVKNLFYQDNDITRNIKLTIEQELDNSETKIISISVGALAKATAKLYDVYVSVKENQDSSISISVYYHDTKMDTLHILDGKTSKEALFDSGILTTKLRTVICE